MDLHESFTTLTINNVIKVRNTKIWRACVVQICGPCRCALFFTFMTSFTVRELKKNPDDWIMIPVKIVKLTYSPFKIKALQNRLWIGLFIVAQYIEYICNCNLKLTQVCSTLVPWTQTTSFIQYQVGISMINNMSFCWSDSPMASDTYFCNEWKWHCCPLQRSYHFSIYNSIFGY